MLNLYMIWHIMYYYLFRLFMLRISLWHAFRIETEAHTRTTLCVYNVCISGCVVHEILYFLSVCVMFFLRLRFPYFVNMRFLNYLIDITINVGISPRTMYYLLFISTMAASPAHPFPSILLSFVRSFVHPCHPPNQPIDLKIAKAYATVLSSVSSIWQVDKIGNELRLNASDIGKRSLQYELSK